MADRASPASATATPARTGAVATPTMTLLMFTRQVYGPGVVSVGHGANGGRTIQAMIYVAKRGF